MPSVAIEIAPPSQTEVTPPALVRALVDACALAMHEGDCVLDTDRTETPPTAVAIVRWDGDERHVRIDVGKKSREEPAWQSRELDFSDADARVERWRTAGLTIATLAGEVVRDEAQREHARARLLPRPPQADVPRSKTEFAEPPVPPVRAPRIWADAGGLGGTGVSPGPARFGVWANVGARLAESRFVLLGGADFATVETTPSLSVQWAGISAGLGTEIGTPGVGPLLEPSVAFAVELLRADASDAQHSDSKTQFGYGVHVGATFVWQLGILSPVVGAQGSLNAEPVQILVHDQYVGSVPRLGGLVLLGVRVRIE